MASIALPLILILIIIGLRVERGSSHKRRSIVGLGRNENAAKHGGNSERKHRCVEWGKLHAHLLHLSLVIRFMRENEI